jgi:hypothetical protein
MYQKTPFFPHSAVPSDAPFVVMSPEKGVLSEHENSRAASQGLGRAIRKGQERSAIYARHPDGWRVF